MCVTPRKEIVMSVLSQMMRQCYRSIDDVKDRLQLSAEEVDAIREITKRYPLCLPPYYLDLIDPTDPADPIRRMCIPNPVEFDLDGQEDTSGEADNTVIKGMQHKYTQTVLILSTNQCAMYCRHCFRKRMVGYSSCEVAHELPAMAKYVSEHTEINNVLISGGDALANENSVLEQYLETFSAIPTIDFIRIGTRVPVAMPQRITEDAELLELLRRYSKKKQLFIVTHFNHPREVTEEAIRAIRALQECGCVVRNQTVLLHGVNDDPDVLATLLNTVVRYGVIPYYVFQCRPVMGVKNQFQVPLQRGIDIVEEAKQKISGQAKSLRYAMSHPTGKIEILGKVANGEMLFKYHQAKYAADASRLFTLPISDTQCWLDEISR